MAIEINDKEYLMRRKFQDWIKNKKRIYIVNDCWKLMYWVNWLNKHELADLYFFEDYILVETSDYYFKLVHKIFTDYVNKNDVKVKIKIKDEP